MVKNNNKQKRKKKQEKDTDYTEIYRIHYQWDDI